MRYERVVPVVAVASVVASLLLGIGLLRTLLGDADRDEPTRAATTPVDASIDLDLGRVGDELVSGCIVPGFATDVSEVEVLYGVRQLHLDGNSAVLVLRNAAGDLLLCDRFGADRPAEAPSPTASSRQPVAALSTGRLSWACAGKDRTLRSFEKSTWLAVSPDVETVQQRYWVDGVPGPWFSTRARNGYAHLQTWLLGPEPAGSRFAEQYRVLDASGHALRQAALPTRQKALLGCTAGGHAEID